MLNRKPVLRPYKRGRPQLTIADPLQLRREAMVVDLAFRLDELPELRKGGSEKWCWSCCEWYLLPDLSADPRACDRCMGLEGPFMLPPMARVRVDTDKLTALRRDNGWSQEQLGNLWDVTRGSQSNYERGVHFPLSWQLRALCRILEVPLIEMLERLGVTEYRVQAWTRQGWSQLMGESDG